MKPPAKASSVWVEMPFMRGPVGAQRLRDWLPVQSQIRERTAARRERVLAHEWARKRICQILGHKDAAKWNGYIPPAHRASDGHVDDNPTRAALIELLRDVEAAELAEDRSPIQLGDITPIAPELEPVE